MIEEFNDSAVNGFNSLSACAAPWLRLAQFGGFADMALTVKLLSVYYKQRDNCFFSPLSYAMPGSVMRFPEELLRAIIWSVIVYWVSRVPMHSMWVPLGGSRGEHLCSQLQLVAYKWNPEHERPDSVLPTCA
jgi:hypothetical protein